MTKRRSFSRKDRVRLFGLHNGECYLCAGKIMVGEAWDIEHVVPWELTRDDSDDNLRLAHQKCHKAKTATDIRFIRKADRVHANHIGAKKPSRGFGDSKLKRKIDGSVVNRTTGEMIGRRG